MTRRPAQRLLPKMGPGPVRPIGPVAKDNPRDRPGPPMRQDEILEECLDIHRQLLRLEQDMHRWFSRVSGVEVAA